MSAPSADRHRSRRVVVVPVVGGLIVLVVAAAWAVSRPAAEPVPPAAAATPRFEEVAARAGVSQRYEGDFPYVVGGGVAVLDCDQDGRPDLFLAGGTAPAALFRNRTTVGGDLRFEHVEDPATDLLAVTGAYPLDIDGDGNLDLIVLRLGENVVLRGLGECRFERANERLGFDGRDGMTTAFSATWEGAATLPTLAFGDYVELDDIGRATGRCADGVLLRPEPGGTRYGPSIPLAPTWCALSMLFSDWDRSGRRDLRVSNDRHYYRDGEEQLWRIETGQPPRAYTRDEGWARLQIWGMGIASQDLTGDGFPEVYLTSQGDNKLQILADGPSRPAYEDIALRRGATAHRPAVGPDILPSTAWHPEFADVNDDGYPDLFITKGNVDMEPDHAMQDPSDLLLGQPDGTFVNATEAAGLVDFASARGAALVDLDLDGRLDLVKVVRRADVRIYRNLGTGDEHGPAATPAAAWLAVGIAQEGANADAIGAWLAVRTSDGAAIVEREVTVGGGHAGGQAGWFHLGLGEADRVEVRITWPDGEVGPWLPTETDMSIRIRRGATAVEPWEPRDP